MSALAIGWGAAATVMLVLWLVQLRTRDAGVVDFGWALCIGGLAVAFAATATGTPPQRLLAGALGGIWGFRLALHLLLDRVLVGVEDGRYRHLRAHWGRGAPWHFLWFFQAQALLAVAFALPFFLIAHASGPGLAAVQVAGIALSLLGLIGETVADRQLARFRHDPANRGRTCRRGLWRWSRHPNYFFEWLIWCGFSLASLPAPHGVWMLLLPVAMYLFLTRLTGIPYTEAQALRTRGDDYRAYQAVTSPFFPWPPAQARSGQ